MTLNTRRSRRIAVYLPVILSCCLLDACASYSGFGLKPGNATQEDVIRVMGQPAMRWQAPDNSTQLAYPRGPSGTDTYMVFIGADGKLQHIENVLDPKHFSRVQPGMTEAEVLRILGPPPPGWTTYNPGHDELEWEWRYCNVFNEAARFDVSFDKTAGTVRSATSPPGDHFGFCLRGPCRCSH